jgi:NADH-quinone oxidoreductase subunit L
MGVGAYSSSLFHLATHAFFKCLLFLVAGIVIHQMQHIKDDNNLDIDPQNICTWVACVKSCRLLLLLPIIGGWHWLACHLHQATYQKTAS